MKGKLTAKESLLKLSRHRQTFSQQLYYKRDFGTAVNMNSFYHFYAKLGIR